MIYTATSASSFIGSLGVNGHVSWGNTSPYGNTANVQSAMNYLGLHNMRDYWNPGTAGAFNTLASGGQHFDFMYDPADSGSAANFVTGVHNFEAAHPGAVLSLEGPNEVNSYEATATQLQKDLYTAAKADSLLASKPVFAASLMGNNATDYNNLKIAGYADAGNVHIYWGNGQPAYGWSPGDPQWSWDSLLKNGNIDVPNKPVVVTEAGATTATGVSPGVPEDVQGKQILNALMDAARTHTPFTYLYELVDSHNNGPSDVESHFGLYNYDWTPKAAAVDVHNFTTILSDGGALTGAPGTLDYSLSGNLFYGGHQLFQEADGAKDIVVWSEPDIWDENTRTRIAAPNTPVTIDLATAANVSIYDPLKGTMPVQSLGVTSHITLNVTDHPLIVEVKPAGGEPTPAPTPTPDPGPTPAPAPTTPDPAPGHATEGADVLQASAAMTEIHGGGGADTLTGWSGPDFLTGDDADDVINGGPAFDRTNGNAGADTVHGNDGDDWVSGGKDNDQLYGDDGADIINGNLGNDAAQGGPGDDVVRGGQGDDVLLGGQGGDYISGDLGNDTMSGGLGADTFRAFAGGGSDVILDFNAAEGDHLQLDPGTTWTASQTGADVSVMLGGGAETILKNVQLSSLPAGWIVVG